MQIYEVLTIASVAIALDELYYPPDTEVMNLAAQPSPNETKSSCQPKRWVDILGLFCLGIVIVVAIALVKQALLNE